MLLTDELVRRIHDLHKQILHEFAGVAKARCPQAIAGDIGGGVACFAGAGSPLTQVMGFGHGEIEGNVEQIDEFYVGLCDNWELIVSPFTNRKVMAEIGRAGYIPHHFETVLVQTIKGPFASHSIEIEEVTGDLTEWMDTVDRGWSKNDEVSPDFRPISEAMASMPRTRHYLARIGGEPAGTASMRVDDGLASIVGASTRIPFRGLGIQKALLSRRLQDAGEGKLALMEAVPGSASYRNAQRSGFEPLYSNLIMMRRA